MRVRFKMGREKNTQVRAVQMRHECLTSLQLVSGIDEPASHISARRVTSLERRANSSKSSCSQIAQSCAQPGMLGKICIGSSLQPHRRAAPPVQCWYLCFLGPFSVSSEPAFAVRKVTSERGFSVDGNLS